MKYAYTFTALLLFGLSGLALFLEAPPITRWALLIIGFVCQGTAHILARIDGERG